jgi:hypothetical protein
MDRRRRRRLHSPEPPVDKTTAEAKVGVWFPYETVQYPEHKNSMRYMNRKITHIEDFGLDNHFDDGRTARCAIYRDAMAISRYIGKVNTIQFRLITVVSGGGGGTIARRMSEAARVPEIYDFPPGLLALCFSYEERVLFTIPKRYLGGCYDHIPEEVLVEIFSENGRTKYTEGKIPLDWQLRNTVTFHGDFNSTGYLWFLVASHATAVDAFGEGENVIQFPVQSDHVGTMSIATGPDNLVYVSVVENPRMYTTPGPCDIICIRGYNRGGALAYEGKVDRIKNGPYVAEKLFVCSHTGLFILTGTSEHTAYHLTVEILKRSNEEGRLERIFTTNKKVEDTERTTIPMICDPIITTTPLKGGILVHICICGRGEYIEMCEIRIELPPVVRVA